MSVLPSNAPFAKSDRSGRASSSPLVSDQWLPKPWIRHYPSFVPPFLDYPEQPVYWLLEQAATEFPDRIACLYYSQEMTYGELLAQARALAASLIRSGVDPGDRVGILLPNIPEYLVALNGIWMAGGTAVALSPLFVAEEASSFVNSTDCKVVITLDVLTPLICNSDVQPELVLYSSLGDRISQLERLGYAWVRFMRIGFGTMCPNVKVERLEDAIKKSMPDEPSFEPVKMQSQDRAYILPTGGTTSAPKSVVLTHGNLLANALQIAHWSGYHRGEETILAVLPFFHSYGLSTCLTNGLALGATLILHHRFRTASVINLIEKHRPTLFPAVPAMLVALNAVLRNKKADMSSIRAVISGGAHLPVAVATEFSKYSGANVVEGYGLSEASPVTHAGPLDGRAVPGTIGLPVPDTEAKVVDAVTGTQVLPIGEVGELIVRGPQVMQGYWNDPEATSLAIRDGWLFTGDLVTCNEDGFFRVVDRKKDLIITSGFNVYPADVEAVLRTYPGLKDVAVVGVPDEQRGEVVKAYVVMEPGKKFHKEDFENFTRMHLSAHKRPRLVEQHEGELPKNFLGKILKRELRGTSSEHIEEGVTL